MHKLTAIQKAISKLTSDEIHQLIIWLLTKKLLQSGRPEPFQGILLIGSFGIGKSVAINKLSGNQS
ncbi:hypothetical protein [Spirosoma gilvum]